jgi:hypothetical protein
MPSERLGATTYMSKEELPKIIHIEHRDIGGSMFVCLYDDKGNKYLKLEEPKLDFTPRFTDADAKTPLCPHLYTI